jgi:hypothetical protein
MIMQKKFKYQILSKFVQQEQNCSLRIDGQNESNSRFPKFF